ncbi:MAG: sigma-70 family RNA polymerase sigma factor, partial [Coriobacteriales bacterium]|nr:sigma-70 family RNA polymerase sigma factor [Coriobacteriales bacterium]
MAFRNQQVLLKALRRRDVHALEAVIDEYGGYVMAVALHTLGSLGNRQDAEEIVSDVFVALWKNAAKLAPDSNLKPWLAVVARNTSLKRLRTLKPVQSFDAQTDEVLATLAVLQSASYDEPGASDETDEQMTDVLFEGLSSIDRELLQRHYGEEQSISDIAQE